MVNYFKVIGDYNDKTAYGCTITLTMTMTNQRSCKLRINDER